MLINVDCPLGLLLLGSFWHRNSRHTLPRPQPCWPQQLAAAHEPRRCMNFHEFPTSNESMDDRWSMIVILPITLSHILVLISSLLDRLFYRSCLQILYILILKMVILKIWNDFFLVQNGGFPAFSNMFNCGKATIFCGVVTWVPRGPSKVIAPLSRVATRSSRSIRSSCRIQWMIWGHGWWMEHPMVYL